MDGLQEGDRVVLAVPNVVASNAFTHDDFRRSMTFLADGRVQAQPLHIRTNILLTRFLGENGIAEISDFMAMQHLGHSHNLVRRVKVVRGEVKFRVVCAPKFDYGRSCHKVERKNPHEIIFVPAKKNLSALRLRGTVPLKIENGEAIAGFKLGAEKTASFILEEADGESPSVNPNYVSEAFKETMNFWLGWVAHSKYRGRWREMVNRSALTLKLLTSQPHGSIVAAPTFGLPENIGGARNWDYRYTASPPTPDVWLRRSRPPLSCRTGLRWHRRSGCRTLCYRRCY